MPENVVMDIEPQLRVHSLLGAEAYVFFHSLRRAFLPFPPLAWGKGQGDRG